MKDKREHFIINDCIGNFRIKNKVKERMHCKHNHTHLSKSKFTKKQCLKLIDDIIRMIVPSNSYLRDSAKRLSRNERYIQNIDIKIEKDKQKPRYINNARVF